MATLLTVSLATSIVEEKENRIFEIIANSIRLRDFLLGKIVGNTLMALAQMVVFAAVGVIGLLAMGKSDIPNHHPIIAVVRLHAESRHPGPLLTVCPFFR